MRAETNKRGIAILVAAGLSIAIGFVCVSTVDHRKTPAGSAQLVSVQELGQMCLEPPAESDQVREASDSNLFVPFEETPVYAAGQEGGQTVELNRQPLRYLKDLDPIYSYVTVDSPTGMIVNLCTGGAICAWSINDNGDVPPRWKIPMKQITGYRVSGLRSFPPIERSSLAQGGGVKATIRHRES